MRTGAVRPRNTLARLARLASLARTGSSWERPTTPHSFRYRAVQRVTLRLGARWGGGPPRGCPPVQPCNRATVPRWCKLPICTTSCNGVTPSFRRRSILPGVCTIRSSAYQDSSSCTRARPRSTVRGWRRGRRGCTRSWPAHLAPSSLVREGGSRRGPVQSANWLIIKITAWIVDEGFQGCRRSAIMTRSCRLQNSGDRHA
jgi:hypothetical protein